MSHSELFWLHELPSAGTHVHLTLEECITWKVWVFVLKYKELLVEL